jgi:hypothetical protein
MIIYYYDEYYDYYYSYSENSRTDFGAENCRTAGVNCPSLLLEIRAGLLVGRLESNEERTIPPDEMEFCRFFNAISRC